MFNFFFKISFVFGFLQPEYVNRCSLLFVCCWVFILDVFWASRIYDLLSVINVGKHPAIITSRYYNNVAVVPFSLSLSFIFLSSVPVMHLLHILKLSSSYLLFCYCWKTILFLFAFLFGKFLLTLSSIELVLSSASLSPLMSPSETFQLQCFVIPLILLHLH